MTGADGRPEIPHTGLVRRLRGVYVPAALVMVPGGFFGAFAAARMWAYAPEASAVAWFGAFVGALVALGAPAALALEGEEPSTWSPDGWGTWALRRVAAPYLVAVAAGSVVGFLT